jgi:hypothetical protein
MAEVISEHLDESEPLLPPRPIHEIKGTPKKKTIQLRRWFDTLTILPLTNVSRIHLYEARERYFNLMEVIRYHARLYGLNLPDYENEDFDFPLEIREVERKISQDDSIDDERKNKIYSLLSCYEILIDTRKLLTRKQKDLNRLWRALTRVRSRLTKIITSPAMQASQLYFCQEEAYRLGVDDDPSIKTMLQDLAEAIDTSGQETCPKYICTLHALLERFNTIRTGRIHQQFINIRTYWVALLILMVISFIIIKNYDVILSVVHSPASTLKEYLKQNMLAFIFLGGLTGGFFSVTTRTRPRDFVPGEDAYYTTYILTKPFIGAFGAIILYILINGEFVTQEIIQAGMMDKLQVPGPVSFGFALIAGFSERIVFPKFR